MVKIGAEGNEQKGWDAEILAINQHASKEKHGIAFSATRSTKICSAFAIAQRFLCLFYIIIQGPAA